MNLIERAATFARQAHESVGQVRKYTGEPYIIHPEAVAAIVASVTNDEQMICAAWLHDVVEDTPVTLDTIRAEFGADIATLVDGLTNRSKPEDGNRKVRNAIDKNHTAGTDSRTKTVKLADVIHNLTGIVEQNPQFAKRYLAEKEDSLAALKEGNAKLMKRLKSVIHDEKAKLKQA